MLGKYWVPSRESVVKSMKDTFVMHSMTRGFNIVIDNMNLNPKEVQSFKDIITVYNTDKDDRKKEGTLNDIDDFRYELEFKDFKTPIDVCIERDSKREHPIGAKVITETYNRYKDFYSEN